jgi:uncharacterized membrane protein YeaQ/YmgE (transglycosylase-associated protein family)
VTFPSIIIGFVISTLYGTAFHFWRGDGIGRMLLYIILAWIGFWAGHLLGNFLEITIGNLGPLHLGTATIGAGIALGIGYWLLKVEN